MSISPLSNNAAAFRIPQQDLTPRVSETQAPSIQAGGCGSKPESSPLGDLFKDSFGGAEKGGGLQQFLEGANELIKTLNQLKDLLQEIPELGGDSPTGGAEAAAGAGGADAAGASAGVQGAGEAPEGQVGDWIKQAQQALAAAGVPADKMNAADIARIIEHESSGNPNAINNWDSNAQKGTPSIGLMQTIQPTFDANKLPGHDDIRNPVDNIIAGVRYAVERYGSVSNVPGIQGLNNGGAYVGY